MQFIFKCGVTRKPEHAWSTTDGKRSMGSDEVFLYWD